MYSLNLHTIQRQLYLDRIGEKKFLTVAKFLPFLVNVPNECLWRLTPFPHSHLLPEVPLLYDTEDFKHQA